MNYPIYQIDAFTNELFKGNPAAVVVLDQWPDKEILHKIAAENNLSETAFIVGANGQYFLRWFTPEIEMDLCGHATLSAAHVIFTEYETSMNEVVFKTNVAGDLTVTRKDDGYVLDFPSRAGTHIDVDQVPAFIKQALSDAEPTLAISARDLMLVYNDAAIVRAMKPNFAALKDADQWIIVTAPSDVDGVDCISRFFCAGDGIDEDPVTGSAHCTIVPYWSEKLGRDFVRAYQASARGGYLDCTMVKHDNGEDRVYLKGQAVTYMKGMMRYE